MIGIFEPNAKNAFSKTGKVPSNFSFGEFKVDKKYVNTLHNLAAKRIPEIDNLKINDLINEYESLLFKKDEFSKFNINNKLIDGRILGVNQSGKLKVKIGNKIIREYNSSEIKIIY